MKKNKHINKLFLALSLSVFVLGCSDDDGDSASAGFAGVGSSYQEADGPGDVFIPYRDGSLSESDITVSGSATEGEDYTVSYGADGITVSIVDDNLTEPVETIQFTIANTSGASNKRHTVSIESDEPGFLAIDLTWTGPADMDLWLFYKAFPEDSWHALAADDPGHLELDWTEHDYQYGLGYNYYAGTANPLNFTVTFNPSGGDNITVNGGSTNAVYNATYTLVNREAAASGAAVAIVQTFYKTGFDFHTFSGITVPATGSRQAGAAILGADLILKK